MYFAILIAYALLLTDGVPPPQWDLLSRLLSTLHLSAWRGEATVGFALLQIPAAALTALWVRRRALRARNGTWEGDVELEDRYARGGFVLLCVMTAWSNASLLLTGLLPMLRREWNLSRYPVVPDTLALLPLFAAAIVAWMILFPADRAVRAVAIQYHARDGAAPARPWTAAQFLIYRIRHQILTVAIPMSLIVLVKYFTDQNRRAIISATRIVWLPESLVGIGAVGVLLISPLLLRVLWDTRPLPEGPLRTQLETLGRRIGLRYRDILVWQSQSLIVNAAVMGLFAPVRYVLFSDGMLQALTPRQIEAVFGHEAGHVRRWHLWYFGVFALLSMLLVGGLLELLVRYTAMGQALLQLVALGGMVLVWGMAFGYVSRRFERQADLYGTLCLAADADLPAPAAGAESPGAAWSHPSWTPPPQAATPPPTVAAAFVSGARSPLLSGPPGLRSARLDGESARVFGQTLIDVAHLNGIPVEARSWRHGSVQSRCELLARFARHPEAILEFERRVEWLKHVMLILTAIGSAIAAWLYWPF